MFAQVQSRHRSGISSRTLAILYKSASSVREKFTKFFVPSIRLRLVYILSLLETCSLMFDNSGTAEELLNLVHYLVLVHQVVLFVTIPKLGHKIKNHEVTNAYNRNNKFK